MSACDWLVFAHHQDGDTTEIVAKLRHPVAYTENQSLREFARRFPETWIFSVDRPAEIGPAGFNALPQKRPGDHLHITVTSDPTALRLRQTLAEFADRLDRELRPWGARPQVEPTSIPGPPPRPAAARPDFADLNDLLRQLREQVQATEPPLPSIPTWRVELAIVGLLLLLVAGLAGPRRPLELLAAAAVLLSFAHAQVADRMAEREALRARPDVHCWRWSRRYWIGKECLWFAYFAARGAWSALAGCVIFIAYPFWRRFYRRRHAVS